MNKRLGAGLLAAASTASILGVTAAQPASASPTPCGTYPPGQAYVIGRAPVSGTVARGTLLLTRGTLRRSAEACVGFPLGAYVKYDNIVNYVLKGSGTTSTSGSVYVRIAVPRTLRFFYNLNLGSVSVRSATSEIIAR